MAGKLTERFARKRPLILDGAMGTELQRRGIDTGLPLWSARALETAPDTILAIHQEYIEAGADIITTNTFRTTRRTFIRAKLPDRSSQLTSEAVALATEARERSGHADVLIAGSMAPLEDCYRPDLVPPDAELREEHRELASRLARAGVDLILLETMGTIREALAACEAAVNTGKETVVSFTLDPKGNLLGGESLSDAVRTLERLSPAAFSLNCVAPRGLKEPVTTLRSLTKLPIFVYGNIGREEGDRHGWEFIRDIDEKAYASFAAEWITEGAAVVGGCCGTTPEYIRILKDNLPQRHEDLTR